MEIILAKITLWGLAIVASIVAAIVLAIKVLIPAVMGTENDYQVGNQEINYFNNLYKMANKGYQDEAWWTTKKRMAVMFILDWFKGSNKTSKINGMDLCAIYHYLKMKTQESSINTLVEYVKKNFLLIVTSIIVFVYGLQNMFLPKENKVSVPTSIISVVVLISIFMFEIALVARNKRKESIANENIDKELYISLCEAILKGTTEEELVKLCSDYFDNPDVVKDTDATSFAAIFKRTKNNHKVEKKNIKK